MRIVHFSDLHSGFYRLPEADIYVCTGDMLPNFWTNVYRMKDGTIKHWSPNDWVVGKGVQLTIPNGTWLQRIVDPQKEEMYQRIWIDQLDSQGGFRKLFLASPEAPVVCVRGNHDFTDLTPLFDWMNPGKTYEIQDPGEVFDVLGLRFGGLRGINYIAGEWSDELQGEQFHDRVKGLSPACDILVSHSPPQGILDRLGEGYGDVDARVGSPALRSYLDLRSYSGFGPVLQAHLFGHIHGSKGKETHGGTLFSNAATGHQLLEL